MFLTLTGLSSDFIKFSIYQGSYVLPSYHVVRVFVTFKYKYGSSYKVDERHIAHYIDTPRIWGGEGCVTLSKRKRFDVQVFNVMKLAISGFCFFKLFVQVSYLLVLSLLINS